MVLGQWIVQKWFLHIQMLAPQERGLMLDKHEGPIEGLQNLWPVKPSLLISRLWHFSPKWKTSESYYQPNCEEVKCGTGTLSTNWRRDV